jgi:predicted methyltransferase
MDVQIGSSLYTNTDGTVEVDGLPQIILSKKPSGGLLVNFVVYDEVGRVIAKVVDSTMAFNERRAHDVTRTPSGLMITHLDSGKTLLKVEAAGDGPAKITLANFLTVKGHVLEVSPTEWRIDKKRVANQTVDAQGTAAVIG